MTESAQATATIHATAVLVGARAILIRGPAGSGKSTLALRLIEAADTGRWPFVRLVGDDRVHVGAVHGRVLVRPAPSLAGLLEVRGLGIRRMPFEAAAVVSSLVELADPAAQRLPQPAQQTAALDGISLPRLAVAQGADPLPAVIAFLREAGVSPSGVVNPI